MASTIRVGVLDEQEVVHYGLRGGCSDQADIAIMGAYYRSGSATRAVARGDIDLLIMEYRLKGREGFNFIRNLKIQRPKLRILVYLADPCPATVAVLLSAGVHGAVGKHQPLNDCIQAIRLLASGQSYWGPEMSSVDSPDSSPLPTVDNGAEAALLSLPSLSLREREVLRLCISGLTVTSIAELWSRSPKTVSTQKQAAYRKLGLKSDMDLFRKLAHYGD